MFTRPSRAGSGAEVRNWESWEGGSLDPGLPGTEDQIQYFVHLSEADWLCHSHNDEQTSLKADDYIFLNLVPFIDYLPNRIL